MNKTKIVLFGARGMLGHDLAEVFSGHDLELLDYEELDITDEKSVQEVLSKLKPSVVINAAAYTDVDGAELDQDKSILAYQVNGDSSGYIAKVCKEIGAILVHYSTEYVFDGTNEAGYTEDSKVSPANVYGKSKAQGEEMIQKYHDKFYILRSSWLYGKSPQRGKPRGLNFVETMLKLAKEKDELSVVNDQFGKPTFTKDLAQETKKILDNSEPFGIYHVVNDGQCSWYDFAKEIFRIKGMDIKVNSISSKEYSLPTPRPKYSILQNTKLEPLRSWQEALKDYLK